MNAGGTFSFASLAGIDPHPFPSLRPIDHAYLRDRLVVDPRVQGLYQPPVIGSVTPDSVENSLETLTVTGTGFLDPPRLRLVNDTWTYELPVETFVSDTEVTGLVIRSQILPGLYDLEMIAADGQEDVLPGAVTVP